VRLSRHALQRFVERYAVEPSTAADELRQVLARTRRLGRNPHNGAIAVLGIYRAQVLVAVVQQATCLTVLTWNQFVPRLVEFGRKKLPRKWGRSLHRLTDQETREPPRATDQDSPSCDPDASAGDQHRESGNDRAPE
jgi:hypothetical protein